MSKKQFTLDSWLKDKSQKVVTRCGFPVRIVCTDVKRKDYPILALVERDDQEEYQSFTKDGRFSLYNPLHDNFDLFIETADEVSEDEKILEIIKHCIESRYLHTSTIKGISQKQCLAWLEKQGQVKESTISQHENRICKENDDSLTSEGENVRKELIDAIQGLWDNDALPMPLSVKRKDKWLAWLEKQGEKKPADSYCQENCKGFQETGKCFADGECKAKREAEQKPVIKFKTAEESLGISSDEYNKIVDECIFGEQKLADKNEPKFKVGEKELTEEELREGLIRGMINEHNRVVKEVLRTEYEKGRADVLAKIDAIDVDEMVCDSGATSRVTQYWYAHGVNDVIKKLKEEQV